MRSLAITDRNLEIATRFGLRAQHYDEFAGLQARVAAELAGFMPSQAGASVLEIGCGTGLFTEHLLGLYPEGCFYITDLSDDMLQQCRNRIPLQKDIRLINCDGEKLRNCRYISCNRYDIIASSMTIQWFRTPETALLNMTELLEEDGSIYYAAPTAGCFPEWTSVFNDLGLQPGVPDYPKLPGVFKTQRITVKHDNALSFFRSIKAIGAATPREGYTPISATAMRQAFQMLDERCDGCFTWIISYGHLRKQGCNQ